MINKKVDAKYVEVGNGKLIKFVDTNTGKNFIVSVYKHFISIQIIQLKTTSFSQLTLSHFMFKSDVYWLKL